MGIFSVVFDRRNTTDAQWVDAVRCWENFYASPSRYHLKKAPRFTDKFHVDEYMASFALINWRVLGHRDFLHHYVVDIECDGDFPRRLGVLAVHFQLYGLGYVGYLDQLSTVEAREIIGTCSHFLESEHDRCWRWLARDADGIVACFDTCGFAWIPRRLIIDERKFQKLSAFLFDLEFDEAPSALTIAMYEGGAELDDEGSADYVKVRNGGPHPPERLLSFGDLPVAVFDEVRFSELQRLDRRFLLASISTFRP